MSWGRYKNGNYNVWINLEDGTKIRFNDSDELIPDTVENIDLKITDCCYHGCEFCYANSCPQGKHGDIMNLPFLNTMEPYTEVACGGGTVFTHPQLIPFLHMLKDKKLIASITVNQRDFMTDEVRNLLRSLVDQNLIYGIGISLVKPTKEFIRYLDDFPQAVVHVINGIVSTKALKKMANKNIKILILGYKHVGRGVDMYERKRDSIIEAQKNLYDHLPQIVENGWFKVVSFDNLAIKQLKPARFLDKEYYGSIYLGDDGFTSMYIDAVNKTFSKSSLESESNTYPLEDNIKSMYSKIKSF